MSSGHGAAAGRPSRGDPRVIVFDARSEVNVFIRRRIRDGKWLILAAGAVAVCASTGLVNSSREPKAVAATREEIVIMVAPVKWRKAGNLAPPC